MAQKMKLVSQALYNTLMNLKGQTAQSYHEKLDDKKRQVLESDSIPMEVKSRLYQDYNRELLESIRRAENKPVMVKNAPSQTAKKAKSKSTAEENDEKEAENYVYSPFEDKGENMMNYLKSIGVEWDEEYKIIDERGNALKGSDVRSIAQQLIGKNRLKHGTKGMKGIAERIFARPPNEYTMLSNKAREMIFEPKAPPRNTRSGKQWGGRKLRGMPYKRRMTYFNKPCTNKWESLN
jgi:hypothetical protein